MKKLLLLMMGLLFVGAVHGYEYEVTTPCQINTNESFTITTLINNAEGDIAVGYELPEGLLRDTAELSGVMIKDAKVDGNTHKWTVTPTKENTVNISMTVVPVSEGDYTFYVYTILPPGQEQRDERTITVIRHTQETQLVKEEAVTTAVETLTKPETDWKFFIQVVAVLGTLYYLYSCNEKDKKEAEERLPYYEEDSHQQTQEVSDNVR